MLARPSLLFLLLGAASFSLLVVSNEASSASDDSNRLITALTALRKADEMAKCELQHQARQLRRLRAANGRLKVMAGRVRRNMILDDERPDENDNSKDLGGTMVACGPEAASLGGGCSAIRRLYGLKLDGEAAALCDGYELCQGCAAAVGQRDSRVCDRVYVRMAARQCMRQDDPESCGRQADQLLAVLRRHYGRRQGRYGSGAKCSRTCANRLFSRNESDD